MAHAKLKYINMSCATANVDRFLFLCPWMEGGICKSELYSAVNGP
jgi:hypothetical protein